MRKAGTFHSGPEGNRFSSPLIPGIRDGLGERWSSVLAADGSHVELLQLRSEAASAPGFEEALRARIAQLHAFPEPTFAAVHELYRDQARLTLVSALVPGRRLSDLTARDLPRAKRPALVARVLQNATHALAALEHVAPGVTHAALTTDRLLVTPGGGLFITEHVFGSALQALALWPEELYLQFGLLAPAEEVGQSAFDARTTVMQLGAVALSVLLERGVTLEDFDHRRAALVDEFVTQAKAATAPPALVAPLRAWLERALQVNGGGYASASEAEKGLTQLLAAAGPGAAEEMEAAQFPVAQPRLVGRTSDEKRTAYRPPAPAPAVFRPAADAGQAAALFSTEHRPPASRLPGRTVPEYVAWVAAALAVVAIGEGAFIARLTTRSQPLPAEPTLTIESSQPGTTVMVNGRQAGTTPLKLQVNEETRAIQVVPPEPVAAAPVATPIPASAAEANGTAAALEQAAARQKSGGVAFVSPIQLSVLEGERVLGSTSDGPIVAGAGTHTLDLINSALGFRVQQVVTIRAGAISRVPITPPMGRLSINAQPWAQVLIDDNAVGDTPLANLPATLGEHEITFRHPQFGERRERVVVRADAPARVSTTFQR